MVWARWRGGPGIDDWAETFWHFSLNVSLGRGLFRLFRSVGLT
eukprot:SAG11_NODE_25139_length_363_cov_0.890152_1_plen_42_part_01